MSYRRLFIIRKDLNLCPGKLAAMVGHCAEAYWTRMISRYAEAMYKPVIKYGKIDPYDHEIILYEANLLINKNIFEQYIEGSFVKTICEARNKNHLLKAKMMAEEMGLKEGYDFGLIRDNCLTELTPEDEDGRTTVGIWFKPLPDEKAHKISKKYHLYM